MTSYAEPTTRLEEANHFEFTGPIVLSYSRSSISGGPRLAYHDGEQELSFADEDITQASTAMGELVTVTLQHVPDAFVRTFTLVVPTVKLRVTESVELDAIGVETVDRSGSLVPSAGPAGVLQTYRVHDLRGVAQHVRF